MIRVLICDDQDVVRQGLKIILSHSAGLEVVGLAADGEEAVRLTAELSPDVVLMDLKMPLLNGIGATRRISHSWPQTKIVVLTTYDGDDWVFDAIRAGAAGYLLKDAEGEAIAQAVREAHDGRVHLDPQIAGKVVAELNRLNTAAARPQSQDALADELSERELSILQLMADGLSNGEIAEQLFLAEGTVKNNVSNIIGKLRANGRTQAVIFALRRGLVSLAP